MHRLAHQRTNINTTIYDMRQSGATLHQIADKIGKTKERVRQILIQNYGSIKNQLISTEQLCQLSGRRRNRITELYQGGAITPVVQWHTGNRHFLLWSPATSGQVISYYEVNKLCTMCHRPVPKGRRTFCSEQCCKEGHKYRYRSPEARERHRISMRNRKRTKRIRQSEGHLKG